MFSYCRKKALIKKLQSYAVNNNDKKIPTLLNILRKLNEDQLNKLYRAIQHEGCMDGSNGTIENCILLDDCDEEEKEETILTLCLSFRCWTNVSSTSELRILSGICGGGLGRPPECCCNPYHWSKVLRPQRRHVHQGMNVQKRSCCCCFWVR